MPIKNYTSSQPAIRSIAYIENKLAQKGATQILKEYDACARVARIKFSILVDGREMYFCLPAQITNCEKVLMDNLSQRARPETRKKIPAQAERTAWKILADWVDAQMAMIELSQVELLQVFLSYVWNGEKNQTFYETIKAGNMKLLTGK